MRTEILLLTALAACSARATRPPADAASASCDPQPIAACSADVSAVEFASLSSAPPAAGAEVTVLGHLRRSDLVRCFTNRICVEGKCSSSCSSPLVVSSTREATAAQRAGLESRDMVAADDLGTQSSCEGDEKALCCPYDASPSEVAVTGKVVADPDAPERWRLEVTSVCRPSGT